MFSSHISVRSLANLKNSLNFNLNAIDTFPNLFLIKLKVIKYFPNSLGKLTLYLRKKSHLYFTFVTPIVTDWLYWIELNWFYRILSPVKTPGGLATYYWLWTDLWVLMLTKFFPKITKCSLSTVNRRGEIDW